MIPRTNTGAQSGVQNSVKKRVGKIFKNLLLHNYYATICVNAMQASLACIDSVTPGPILVPKDEFKAQQRSIYRKHV